MSKQIPLGRLVGAVIAIAWLSGCTAKRLPPPPPPPAPVERPPTEAAPAVRPPALVVQEITILAPSNAEVAAFRPHQLQASPDRVCDRANGFHLGRVQATGQLKTQLVEANYVIAVYHDGAVFTKPHSVFSGGEKTVDTATAAKETRCQQ